MDEADAERSTQAATATNSEVRDVEPAPVERYVQLLCCLFSPIAHSPGPEGLLRIALRVSFDLVFFPPLSLFVGFRFQWLQSAPHNTIVHTTILEPPNSWILVPVHSSQYTLSFNPTIRCWTKYRKVSVAPGSWGLQD